MLIQLKHQVLLQFPEEKMTKARKFPQLLTKTSMARELGAMKSYSSKKMAINSKKRKCSLFKLLSFYFHFINTNANTFYHFFQKGYGKWHSCCPLTLCYGSRDL